MANMPYNNVKTQLCRFWQKDGKCKYGKNCSYAHGDFELRKPYHALPKDATQPYQKTQENEMNGDQKNGFYQGQQSNMNTPNKQDGRYPYNDNANRDRPKQYEHQQEPVPSCSSLRILMNENDKNCCNKMLQANRLIQMGQQEQAYDII